MIMKRLGCAALLAAVSLPALADASSELLSAQAAYRQALQAQNKGDNKIADLQNKLKNAEERRQAAENDISRYRAELQQASEAKVNHDSTLKAAGERLDAAWRAAQQSGVLPQQQ